MRLSLFCLAALVSCIASGQDEFFERSEQFFRRHMVNNRINYAALQSDPEDLNSLVAQIGNIQEDDLTHREFKAFYINAYNVLVIKGVVDRYPFENLLDQEGFFDTDKYYVAGQSLTLDEIEFQKLFARERDPRFHFVLNCAAYSCPTLFNQAMNPDELEEQLDFAIKVVIDRDDYVFVDRQQRKVFVSKIFDWYKEDFTRHQSLRQFINENRFTSLPSDFEIDFLPYDWRLNDSNNPARDE